MNSAPNFSLGQWLRSRTGLGLLAFLGIAAFFLAIEYTAHFFGILPWLLLLLCPLLHSFMHGGHGDHGVHMGREGHADGGTQPSHRDHK